MEDAKVEFFTEDIDDVEYLNVGLAFPGKDGEMQRCVLGAFSVSPEEDGLMIIQALVEEAAGYILGAWAPDANLQVVVNELLLP